MKEIMMVDAQVMTFLKKQFYRLSIMQNTL